VGSTPTFGTSFVFRMAAPQIIAAKPAMDYSRAVDLPGNNTQKNYAETVA
jgi:hypothetical protein